MKKNIIKAIVGTAFVCTLACVPIETKAATPEEAAEIARQYGYSEDMIQEGWNRYNENPERYTPEIIDMAIDQLKESGGKIVTNVPYNPDVTIPALTTVTTAVQEVTTTAAAGNKNTETTPAQTAAATETPSNSNPVSEVTVSDDIELTMPDGTTFTRISKKRFQNLSYADKMAYLGTFTPEQQTVFINNLSPEEYRSIMKQLPADKKAEVVDTLSEVTDDLGLNLTVEEMSDDGIKIAMKDETGKLVGISQAGDTVVEKTGYDKRGIFAFAAVMYTAALCGLAAVIRRYCVKGEENE